MSKTPASFNAGISTNFLKQRIETFSSKNKVSISLVSFNVNSKNPIKFNFNSQIVVFGLQEIDTSTSAYLIDNKELWSTSLLPTHQLVAKKQLVFYFNQGRAVVINLL